MKHCWDKVELMQFINQAILEETFGLFKWTSLQVNINTASTEHCDSNNLGMSAIITGGPFSGGNFYLSINGKRVKWMPRDKSWNLKYY